jgi:diaminopimelate epimerase
VAKYLDKEKGTLQTSSFLSQFWKKKERITVSLKQPTFGRISHLPQGLNRSYKIDVGNPHLVIFTENSENIDFQRLAYSLQPPQGINVELAHVLSPNKIQVQVWERGVGITPACGSGACAVGILGIKLGLVSSSPVYIKMEGGDLEIKWEEGSPPLLTGPAEFCFKGMLTLP